MPHFETIDHTADTGIRAFGATEAGAFESAAAGMFSIITNIGAVRPKERFEIQVEAEDRETLLVEWLNELLYLYDSRNVVLGRFHIEEMGEAQLRGAAWGEPIDPARHELGTDIKAVTYHMLKVGRTDGEWVAEVIFDI